MLSDKEKEAIEVIKGLAVYYDDYSLLDKEEIEENEEVNNSINIVINLIEKQSKEIEELKDKNKSIVYNYETVVDKLENSTPNYKIKAIIEELQEDIKYSANPLSIDNSKFGIKVLQSLLEKE